MIIKPDGQTRFLTVEEHLQRSPVVYQDTNQTVCLTNDKQMPFRILEQGGENNETYIDMFAMRFGIKEPLTRRTGTGTAPLWFGCGRAERDRLLLLPVKDLIEEAPQHTCSPGCQYYSPPTGVRSPYAFPCILIRYRVLNVLDMKSGLTLEEVGRIYGCTRERIRQIQQKAMTKLRHNSRRKRLKIFQEQASEYQDEAASSLAAGGF